MTTVPIGFLSFEDLIGFQHKPKSKKIGFIKKSTIDDLFEVMENNPDERFELINGQIIAMSNASLNHNTIMNNFVFALLGFFRQGNNPCRLYSDTSCKIDNHHVFQPDFVVICHKSTHQKHLENPILVGEILSSNRKKDIEIKLPLYQNTPSIQEILYLEQKIMQITVYRRNAVDKEIWEAQTYKQGETITLQSVGFTITVENFYVDVEF